MKMTDIYSVPNEQVIARFRTQVIFVYTFHFLSHIQLNYLVFQHMPCSAHDLWLDVCVGV